MRSRCGPLPSLDRVGRLSLMPTGGRVHWGHPKQPVPPEGPLPRFVIEESLAPLALHMAQCARASPQHEGELPAQQAFELDALRAMLDHPLRTLERTPGALVMLPLPVALSAAHARCPSGPFGHAGTSSDDTRRQQMLRAVRAIDFGSGASYAVVLASGDEAVLGRELFEALRAANATRSLLHLTAAPGSISPFELLVPPPVAPSAFYAPAKSCGADRPARLVAVGGGGLPGRLASVRRAEAGPAAADDLARAAVIRNATFCLIPDGSADVPQRLFESVLAMCIPILVAAHLHVPASRFWRRAAVTLSKDDWQGVASEDALLQLLLRRNAQDHRCDALQRLRDDLSLGCLLERAVRVAPAMSSWGWRERRRQFLFSDALPVLRRIA